MNNEPKAKRTEKKGGEKQEIWQKITQETEKIFNYHITNIFLNVRSFKKINKTKLDDFSKELSDYFLKTWQ